MLDAADVGRGTLLLDAGCGAGGASLLAVRRGALVNGLDAAEALLAIARQRVPDGDFRAGDLEVLPYAGATFDAVIAADVLPYTVQPVVALRELARVCRRGARVVVAVRATTPDPVQEAVTVALGGALPAGYGGPKQGARSGKGALHRLVEGATLRVLAAGEVRCPWEYPDRETAWQAHASMGPLQAAARLVGQVPVRAAVLRALAPFAGPDGAVRLVCRYRYVVATPRRAEERAKGDEGV
jgi:SAM-dependent methyltransferase